MVGGGALGPVGGDVAQVVVIEGVDRLQQGMKVAARMASVSNAKENE